MLRAILAYDDHVGLRAGAHLDTARSPRDGRQAPGVPVVG